MADSREEILEVIREDLTQWGVDASSVKPETKFFDDLDLDSLEMAELSVSLEERYGIQIPDEELGQIRTVGDAIDLIERKKAAA